MRTRLLGLTLLTLLSAGLAGAQVLVHPMLAELNESFPGTGFTKERNFATAYMNAHPLLSVPRVGDVSKTTFTALTKGATYSPTNVKITNSNFSCSISTVTTSTVIKVTSSDYYVYSTQTNKMVPAGCGYSDGDLEFLIFPEGKTARIDKRPLWPFSIFVNEFFGDAIWTLSGKKVTLRESEEDDTGKYSGLMSFDLGAKGVLCAFSSSSSTASGIDDVVDSDNTVRWEYKDSEAVACQTPKVVLGKVNTDVLSFSFDGDILYCVQDNDGGDSTECHDAVAEFDPETFPEELLPKIPDLNAVNDNGGGGVDTSDYRLATKAEMVSFIRANGYNEGRGANATFYSCYDFNGTGSGWQTMTRNSTSYLRYGGDTVTICAANAAYEDNNFFYYSDYSVEKRFTSYADDMMVKNYMESNWEGLRGFLAGITAYEAQVTPYTVNPADFKTVDPVLSVAGGMIKDVEFMKIHGIFVVVGSNVRFFRDCSQDLNVLSAYATSHGQADADGLCPYTSAFPNGNGTL